MSFQLNKLKSAIKNATEVTLKLSLNIIGKSKDGTIIPDKLLLTERKGSKFSKVFENNSSAEIKLSRTQISKVVQSGRSLDRLLGSFVKTGLPLKKNVLKPLPKPVLMPLKSNAAASVADAGIYK